MQVEKSHFIFYYPFNYRQYQFEQFEQQLKIHGFQHFKIDAHNSGKNFDGNDNQLLEQYFYPFIEEKLLNDITSPVHFNRYTQKISDYGKMVTPFEEIPFILDRADIHLCPFGIGIVSLRIELADMIDFNTALSFAHFFRVLEPKIEEELGYELFYKDRLLNNTERLLLQEIMPFLEAFFVDHSSSNKNRSKIPFFEDERMYVSAFLQLEPAAEITDTVLYRAGQLNGRDQSGDPYLSSTNKQYIAEFVQKHSYRRWAPDFYMMTTLQAHVHISTVDQQRMNKYINSFHTISYYTVFIHYFYKMMLLKLIFEHSELKFSKDKDIVEELIEQITKFASRYYFSEVSVRSEGKEISTYFRDTFRIETLYRETKETLEELYRIQEDRSTDRLNELIFILTIFSMLSGIYGMNLVIEKLGEPMNLSEIFSYTFFEWIALVLTVGGLVISCLLIVNQLYNLLSSYFIKRQRKRRR